MHRFTAVMYCVLLSLTLVACDRAHQISSEKKISWLNRCPDFATTGKAPVEQNAECGSFEVKENPQDPNSPVIALNVLRLPAVNPVPEADALFFIAGGPGQSAVTVAESIHSVFNEVRKNRDIVFVDQRGTGKSNPLDCEIENDSSKQLSLEEQKEFSRTAIKDCIKKYQQHIPYYTTPFAVADLDAVRAALGYEKINLWGGSYGTRVALDYMRRFPSHIRASVIDGVAPVSLALPWFAEQDGLAALQSLNKQCAQTPACLARYGDIVQKAQVVSDRLLEKSITVTIPHPRTQENYTINLTHLDFSGVVRLALYSRDISSLLPEVISNAEAGNYQLFASLIYLAKTKSDMAGISYGMHFTVLCNEDYSQYKDKDATESQHFLHADMVQGTKEICAQWPRSELPADYWQPIKSDIPVLMLSGAGDPVTPPHWAESVKEGLTNATQVVAPGGHHIITQEGCIPQLIASFIAKGNGQTLDISCASKIQPLAIHLPPESTTESVDAGEEGGKP